jgi:hypothetical protein
MAIERWAALRVFHSTPTKIARSGAGMFWDVV